jgi:hypothetical protein
MKKKLNVSRALIMGAVAYVLMTLFWRFIVGHTGIQTGYEAWALNFVRKITIFGLTAFAFIGGFRCE